MKRLKKMIGKFLNSFTEAVFAGTLFAVILFYAVVLIVIFDIMLETGFRPESAADKTVIALAGVMLFFNIIGIAGCVIFKLRQSPHRYDAELVGDNFIGFGKKIRIFHKAQQELFSDLIPQALSDFRQLEEEFADKTTPGEKALVYFYIARCYQIMDYTPNAVRYYEMAEQTGSAPEISGFFHARALGENGDTDEAAAKYEKILADENNQYRRYVRCDVGRMYLHLNDGEKALKWFSEAIEMHEDYANALGGAAVANTILHNFEQGEELYRQAMLNDINNPDNFTDYYKRVQAAALMETHTPEALSAFAQESAESKHAAGSKEEN